MHSVLRLGFSTPTSSGNPTPAHGVSKGTGYSRTNNFYLGRVPSLKELNFKK